MDVNELEEFLIESKYDKEETEFLIDGFRNGFPLHFEGDRDVRRFAPNLKLECGSREILWNKVMKEELTLRPQRNTAQ